LFLNKPQKIFFIGLEMVTHFARRPGNGKQRGALGRFDNMFGSQPSAASAAQHSSSHDTRVSQSNLRSEVEG
jgi:hypothetical protein